MASNALNGDTSPQTRAVWPAIWRGWRRRCPHCGQGRVLHSYLKVHDNCSACDQKFYQDLAADGPAYLTLLIVGHLVAPLLHWVFVRWRPEPLTLFLVFAVGCVVLSLYLLPRLKGSMIGYQWAKGMGGYGT